MFYEVIRLHFVVRLAYVFLRLQPNQMEGLWVILVYWMIADVEAQVSLCMRQQMASETQNQVMTRLYSSTGWHRAMYDVNLDPEIPHIFPFLS